MKNINKKIGVAILMIGLFASSNGVLFAQFYDGGTTYPIYDGGTTYPIYDGGTTYPQYDGGTTYPTYDTGVYNSGYTYDPGYSYDSGYSYSSFPTTYGSTNYGYNSGYSYPTYSWTGYNSTGYNYTTPTVVTQPPIITNTNCPTGYVLTNGTCVRNVTPPIITNTNCPTGTVLTNGQCVNTVNPPIITNNNCPAGTFYSNGSCVNNNNPPVIINNNCPYNTTYINGVCQQINNPPTIIYQTCWNGTTVPTTSICPAQFKICANGTSIPVNQTCYITPTYIPVTPPVVTRFNNVVTSVATEVTLTSGRCNGIGLIANNALSNGWFEYGETTALGRTTASASIGSSVTAPFSNLLTNLKPSTKYYCRAVMQNQYGTVKGEIVAFTTKSKAVVYVKPVTPTKKVTKTVKKEIICSDGSIVSVGSLSSASLINRGEKLVAVQMEKLRGNLSAKETVSYRLSYKNLSDSRLTGVVIKVTIPQEISFLASSVGNYDEATHMLTLNQDSIDPYTEGVIEWTGRVIKEAPVGKSIVTTSYVVYSVPGTNVQDEVTAYVVGSIVPTSNLSNADTGTKKVIGIGNDRSFLPNNLIEWLALIAILFIIFILGRSIYASYEKDKEGSH